MPNLSVKPSLNAGVVDEVMAAARQCAAELDGAVLFGGGYPFKVDGTAVGGIGGSGGSEAEDDKVARAGLAAVSGAKLFTPEADAT